MARHELRRRLGLRVLALQLILLVTLGGAAISSAAARVPGCEGGRGHEKLDHPLACRIFSFDGKEIGSRQLAEGLAAASLVLLGEVHDNGWHHAIRAKLISGLRPLGTAMAANDEERHFRGPLVFEHIRDDQKAALAGHNGSLAQFEPAKAAAALPAALEWEKSGWPAATLFAPLFAAAASGRFEIIPGDPARADVRRAAREGLATISETERARLQLDAPLPPALDDALLAELEASHCGLMPKSAFGNMAVAQRYRDAHQAAALVTAVDRAGRAVLLAGNGHVRRDRGVPYYLRRMAPGRKVVAVLFLEVEDEKPAASAYIERDAAGFSIADYVVLTPRVERPDPCVEMKRRFAKPKP